MFQRSPRCLFIPRISLAKQFKRPFSVLGIETSCDDTCVAVLDIPTPSSAPIVRHNIVRRSLKLSEPYGGIVPILVGQFHAKELGKVLSEIRDKGGFVGLDLIAVTRGIAQKNLRLICRTWDTNVFGWGVESRYHRMATFLMFSERLICRSRCSYNRCSSYGNLILFARVDDKQAHALTPRLLSPTRKPEFPFYTLLISGGHTLLVYSESIIDHTILLNTRDTAIGDYLDKVARVLKIPWGEKMPGAALEKWSQINNMDESIISKDIDRWNLPRPLSLYKKNVLAFSFTGIRTAVESIVKENPEMGDEEKRSLARAAQVLVFEHVAEKCVRGIKEASVPINGNLVVSGGVACNTALRKMYVIF